MEFKAVRQNQEPEQHGQVLIESDWNLKNISSISQELRISINRIRLEFKVKLDRNDCSPVLVLIESDWNLKWDDVDEDSEFQEGINRIRLEFKGIKVTIDGKAHYVLIESDWNLKILETSKTHIRVLVLIESDWNLKETQVPTTEAPVAY